MPMTMINNIDSSKAYQKGNIPPKRLKENKPLHRKREIS